MTKAIIGKEADQHIAKAPYANPDQQRQQCADTPTHRCLARQFVKDLTSDQAGQQWGQLQHTPNQHVEQIIPALAANQLKSCLPGIHASTSAMPVRKSCEKRESG